MMLLAVAVLLLTSVALTLVYYNHFTNTIWAELKERADLFSHTTHEDAAVKLAAVTPNDMRVSIIAPDGAVVYDNSVAAGHLANHADREEVDAAIQNGFGRSKRFSNTLGEETYYYAVRMSDGFILRTAKTLHSIAAIFERILPVVGVILIVLIVLCYVVARNLTNRIVAPINDVDFDESFTSPYDEFVPFVRAIEEQRKKIDEQFAQLRERWDTIDAIIENMSEGAVLIGHAGRILSANKSALKIFGADERVTGRDFPELFRDKTLLDHTSGALSGSRGETTIERDGLTYHVYFSPVPGSGAILFFLDTTERAKAEKMRSEFSSNVSHELKTPLTSISGYAEMLDSGMVKAAVDQAAFIRKIKDESARLIALVEDIMLISKLDEGAHDEAFEDVNLAEIAEATVGMLAEKAGEARVSITTGGAVIAKANRSMMTELFFNLIDNAIKYNKPGGRVAVTVLREDGRAAISVADTGIGIPEEAQSRVFERFFRVDRSRYKGTGGTGLGLAIVKHIALVHGAQVTLKSAPGEGTTVTVVFGE
jgi:two-component system phosphate regulon sensor histidine kinase PhoR